VYDWVIPESSTSTLEVPVTGSERDVMSVLHRNPNTPADPAAAARRPEADPFWSRLGGRGTARRIEAVDGFQFPVGVRQRLEYLHADLSADHTRTVEAAARQWFRLIARDPKARLSVPSVVVDDLWHELVLHTRDYATFCDLAFGHLLPHEPQTATRPDAADANRNTRLRATLNLARRDESCGPGDLPLLFRVDHDLRIAGGNRYLADCGGRGECFEAPGMVCLRHLAGHGRRTSRRSIRDRVRPAPDYYNPSHSATGGGAGFVGFGGN